MNRRERLKREELQDITVELHVQEVVNEPVVLSSPEPEKIDVSEEPETASKEVMEQTEKQVESEKKKSVKSKGA